MGMENGLQAYETELLAGLSIAVCLLVVSVIFLWVSVRRVKKRYNKIIGNAGFDNVDDLLIGMQERLDSLEATEKQQAEAIRSVRMKMMKMKSNVAVYRYNAFAQQGSDLSFSIAILDDEQDGVVLSGIHSREDSFMYAKPVEKGQSSYTLSPEEKKVIGLSAVKKEA